MRITARGILTVCILALGLAGRVVAQTTQADIAARLVGKPLLLRGFWAQDKLSFHADGTPAGTYSIGPFTLSAVDVTSVKLKSGKLTLEGQRVGLNFGADGSVTRIPLEFRANHSKRSPEKMRIEIEAPPNGDFQQALDAVLAERMSDIAASVPEAWLTYMLRHFPGKRQITDPSLVSSEGVQHIEGDLKPPRVINQPEPTFSQAARAMRVSGSTQVYLWVDKDGTVGHLRIMRPVGMGLDEQALDAVSQYRFAPATMNGKPAKVDMYVEVNFQIF